MDSGRFFKKQKLQVLSLLISLQINKRLLYSYDKLLLANSIRNGLVRWPIEYLLYYIALQNLILYFNPITFYTLYFLLELKKIKKVIWLSWWIRLFYSWVLFFNYRPYLFYSNSQALAILCIIKRIKNSWAFGVISSNPLPFSI